MTTLLLLVPISDVKDINQLYKDKSSFAGSIANIDSLREGFGVYTGEKKVMGEVADSQKQISQK